MIKIENISVYGFEEAIRGMRNPMNSWDKSDSIKCNADRTGDCPRVTLTHPFDSDMCHNNEYVYCVGKNDLKLMKNLFKAGTEHRKYDRMITAYMDITAPLYWWKEFDTYKIGTVANSCSTMHKIHSKEFTLDDFSMEHAIEIGNSYLLEDLMNALNECRDVYNNYETYLKEGSISDKLTKKDVWYTMIELLPSSYNQKRTVMMNYEVCARIVEQREHHKLDEWHVLCDEIKKLPYFKDITGRED